MRFPLLNLLLLGCSGVLGQPVLQPFDLNPLGYTADVIAAEFIAPTPASDQPQTWDFSGVSGSAVALFALEPSTLSPFNDAFSGAEWTNTVGDQVGFWALQEGNFTILGSANAANGVTIPFVDPLVQWTLPMEFGEVVEDTFSADMMLFGQPYSLVGEATTEVDAWGALVMPDGTEIEEVLRANYAQTYEEAYAGDTNTWVLNQVFYFAQDSIMPVFFHEDLVVLDVDSNQILAVTDVAWYANHLLSLPEVEMEVVSLPYPNPVDRGQDVQWELPRGWSWEVVAADGRRLAEGRAGGFGPVSIPTGKWDTGIVLLVPRSSDGRAVGQPHRVFVR
jgi:hypothetical protein